MPELPEVEVVRQVLEERLVGLEIMSIDCLYEPIMEGNSQEFRNKVEHQKITGVNRYAKYLIFQLEQGVFLSHLRMEGKYFYVEEGTPIWKHVHAVFHLSNGYKLCYQDVRKFGRIVFKETNELFLTAPLNKIGIEANQSDFQLEEIYFKLIRKKIPIKTVLLDQTIIAGLGNIYVDEVLFEAHIHPHRLAASITKSELILIMAAGKRILDQAIFYKGTTIRSYTSALGVTGNYQNFLLVHTKTVCPCCKQNLEKEKIGGRTSYYCTNCQR